MKAGADKARLEAARFDHALVRRAQGADEEAFAELVSRHQGRAYRVARNLVPSDEDAQDIAQEAFLRVFRNLERFNFDHEFTTWLYRIVTNLCIDFLRKRRVAVSVSRGKEGDDGEESALDLEDQSEPAPWEYAEAAETASEVHEVLASLAPHFQSVLTLREIEGLGCPEIAEIVGATHVTVRWRLHRGRKLFQEEWERRARMRQQGAANLIQSGAAEGAEISAPTQDQGHRSDGARSRDEGTRS
ncbi:sigma-70 family RNA polymerase sigma factor [Planctomycetota bacterium]|jgi:RNA polymerase sigma-70 factor (ECF subfamily)|nr:sigma-70 family RNA polymerase sigma factor [Planctomycetota bacterium]MDC0585248.1 sigma-70 family RNA polymerase sigma factor [Planctomycetota bacterium]